MQRNPQDMTSHVLMFGIGDNQRRVEHREIEEGLHRMHKGWAITSIAVQSIDEAVEHIRTREDLEIVVFYDDFMACANDEKVRMANVLALVLSKHPHKPWVHINGCGMVDELKSVFWGAGLMATNCFIHFDIAYRRESQILQEVVTA